MCDLDLDRGRGRERGQELASVWGFALWAWQGVDQAPRGRSTFGITAFDGFVAATQTFSSVGKCETPSEPLELPEIVRASRGPVSVRGCGVNHQPAFAQ